MTYNRQKSWRRFLLLSLVVIFIGALFVNVFFEGNARKQATPAAVRDSPAQEMRDVTASTMAAISDAAKSADRQPLSSIAATPPPLPSSDEPLAVQFDALVQRAEAGDPVSTCRLIIGMTRCKEEIRSRNFTDRMLRRLAERRGADDRAVMNALARAADREEQQGKYCKGFDVSKASAVESVLAVGIQQLNVRQKVVLSLTLSNGQLRRLQRERSFVESGLYVYPQFLADHAYDFLVAGFNARDPLALEGLILVHAPGNALHPSGVGMWLPNPRLFLQYSYLMQRIFGPQVFSREVSNLIEVAAASVSSEEISQIEKFVEYETTRWTRQKLQDGQEIQLPPYGRESNAKLTSCDE